MEQLFVYGNLKESVIQKKVFGRIVLGVSDILECYITSKIKIESETYPIIIKRAGSSINGRVISVTSKELELIDAYETRSYQRKKVVLKSGKEVWVYMKPRNAE